jgi:hypothetical protein
MSLEELQPHLHSLPERPDWIPYRTSFYREDWGFCLRHRDRERLEPGPYDVLIDADLAPGHLTYGECVIPGTTAGTAIVYTHTCHPSLANDNLSGIAVAAVLAQALREQTPRLTWRFIFGPGTIGTLTWLSRNEQQLPAIVGGVVLGSLGDGAPLTYKRSRRGDSVTDRVAAHVLRSSATPARLIDFEPYGYDERQFCSPGFDLPIGRLTRSPNGAYRSTTPRRTTCRWCDRSTWRHRCRRWLASWRCWTAIAGRSTAWARASRVWASAGCTAQWAAPGQAKPNTRCSGSSVWRTARTTSSRWRTARESASNRSSARPRRSSMPDSWRRSRIDRQAWPRPPRRRYSRLTTEGRADEGRTVLRRLGNALARTLRCDTEAAGQRRLPTILWHLMRYYAHYGHKDFILALGYRGDLIREYFLTYNECMSNDFVLSEGGRKIELLSSDIGDWRIAFVDTGCIRTRPAVCCACASISRARRVPGQLRRRPERPTAGRAHRDFVGSG